MTVGGGTSQHDRPLVSSSTNPGNEAVDLTVKRSACRDRSPAACSTFSAAAPVLPAAALTPAMLAVTACVLVEVTCTLRAISAVAAPCCSTAEAIEVAIPLAASILLAIAWMATTASCVAAWIG